MPADKPPIGSSRTLEPGSSKVGNGSTGMRSAASENVDGDGNGHGNEVKKQMIGYLKRLLEEQREKTLIEAASQGREEPETDE